MAISWAVGRKCFGIAPKRPLRILYVQAENDEGDLCKMRAGVLEHLQLSEEEEKLLRGNFICAFEGSRMGEEFFIETVGPSLQKFVAPWNPVARGRLCLDASLRV